MHYKNFLSYPTAPRPLEGQQPEGARREREIKTMLNHFTLGLFLLFLRLFSFFYSLHTIHPSHARLPLPGHLPVVCSPPVVPGHPPTMHFVIGLPVAPPLARAWRGTAIRRGDWQSGTSEGISVHDP